MDHPWHVIDPDINMVASARGGGPFEQRAGDDDRRAFGDVQSGELVGRLLPTSDKDTGVAMLPRILNWIWLIWPIGGLRVSKRQAHLRWI